MCFLTCDFVAYTNAVAEPVPAEEPLTEPLSAPAEPEAPAPAVVEPAVEEAPTGALINVIFLTLCLMPTSWLHS